MNDAISRQSVVDMLDETKRIARQNIGGAVLMTFERVFDSLVNITNALPTIQPEIVRCKDCKYTRLTDDGSCKYCDIWFPGEAEYMDGDYYCASAERKSNG